jgi:hypothetical protein
MPKTAVRVVFAVTLLLGAVACNNDDGQPNIDVTDLEETPSVDATGTETPEGEETETPEDEATSDGDDSGDNSGSGGGGSGEG